MTPIETAIAKVRMELQSTDDSVRREFVQRYATELDTFANTMGHAMVAWRTLDELHHGDEQRAYVSALVWVAMSLHVTSTKLLINGHLIPAGNLARQVLETIALAILCSRKETGILKRFMDDEYSPGNAVRDATRQQKTLGLSDEGLNAFKKAQAFYHKYSHVTKLTIADAISFTDNTISMGASFDPAKVPIYTKEIKSRASLAKTLPNAIQRITENLKHW